MKTALALLCLSTLALTAHAERAVRVTNTEHNDGSWSSKEVDPEKKQTTEMFYTAARKLNYKIIYQLDDRLQPVSGLYYNKLGKVFQKSTYTLDGADHMIQEIVYDARDSLVCTKNYIWGTRYGQAALLEVQVYDRMGRLTKTQKGSASGSRLR